MKNWVREHVDDRKNRRKRPKEKTINTVRTEWDGVEMMRRRRKVFEIES